MKKMIPVYLIQLAILVVVTVVGWKILQEIRGTRTALTEITKLQSVSGMREPRDAPALRVKVVGGIYVQNQPLQVEVQR